MNKDREELIDEVSDKIFELVMGGLQTRTREQYAEDFIDTIEANYEARVVEAIRTELEILKEDDLLLEVLENAIKALRGER